MKINEIFYSIQGEGSWTGLPNIFIRTTGCNLRCSFCDTQYAYEDGKEMTIEEILGTIKQYPCIYICLTGGEPLLQHDALDLIRTLLKQDYKICLETNGSLCIDKVVQHKSLLISLDIKCPSSYMHEKICFDNVHILRPCDQLKFVIGNKQDYDYAKTILRTYKPRCTVYFIPVWGTDPRTLSRWILDDGLDAKFGVQLHKILWGNKKGV